MGKVEHKPNLTHNDPAAAMPLHMLGKPASDPQGEFSVNASDRRHLDHRAIHQLAPNVSLTQSPEILSGETRVRNHRRSPPPAGGGYHTTEPVTALPPSG